MSEEETPIIENWKAYALQLEKVIKTSAAIERRTFAVIEVNNMLRNWRKKFGLKEK